MNYIIINFPFSSHNDNNYCLKLILNGKLVDGALAALDADSEVFTAGICETNGNDTIYNYTGTLTGSVKATDDERDDYMEPLVCSKLTFNMAVQTFPAWLINFCTDNRAKVMVIRNHGSATEMWRGYMVGQTLNMTVVNHLLAVQLVAVDEVAMAKYMNFKETFRRVSQVSYCTLLALMEAYYALHFSTGINDNTNGFSWYYLRSALPSINLMLWQRNLALVDDDDQTIIDLPDTLVVNLDRWLQDKEATWQDVFDDIFRYLGVTFAIGGYNGINGNDVYLVTCPYDDPTVRKYIYNFQTHIVAYSDADLYASLSNPQKVGANLQITTEPDRYKEVIVSSTPERWESHEYLTDEHYPEIDHSKYVRYEWGITDDATNGPFNDYGWHKMRYIAPDADEDDFLTIAPCADGEGMVMARLGLLPYVNINSCDGLTAPTAAVANTLDFITFKEGCCCIKMGSGDLSGDDEDSNLKPYFMLLNHMWYNMFNEKSYTMQGAHIADTPWVTFHPLGTVMAVHPSDKHFIKISMDVIFIRENMPVGNSHDGNPNQFTWFAAPTVADTMKVMDWRSPAMLMPSDQTFFDYAEDVGPYNGLYNATLQSWSTLNFKAYIRVGNYYFDGTDWVYVASGSTPPKCTVTLHSNTSEVDEITKEGNFFIKTNNYYYTISNPWRGNNSIRRNSNPEMRCDMSDVSVHNQQVEGQLEMQILGQVDFINANGGVYNSIPFILINNVNIGYTDDAEMLGKDIHTDTKWVIDNSPTKESLKRSIKMATPKVDGFFSNVLVYDGGDEWHNLKQLKSQTGNTNHTPEWWLMFILGQQYCTGQLFVELDTPVLYNTNVRNVDFRVTNLTEASGTFLPVKREFDYTKETMKVKLQRINQMNAD